jgi:hypothetical protein
VYSPIEVVPCIDTYSAENDVGTDTPERDRADMYPMLLPEESKVKTVKPDKV